MGYIKLSSLFVDPNAHILSQKNLPAQNGHKKQVHDLECKIGPAKAMD